MRIQTPTKFAAVLAIATLATMACDRTPTAPGDEVVSTQTGVAETVLTETGAAILGRSGSDVTVPVRLETTFVWNVDQSAEALAACPGTPGIAVGGGSGTGPHLGSFEATILAHCSIDLLPPVGLEDISREGEFEFEAPDGSTLFGTYAFLFLPPEQGGFFSMQVEGGTRRFAGATGVLEFVGGDLTVCDDPLCLVNAVFAPTLEGRLTLPRP